jgi:hypothetical protein
MTYTIKEVNCETGEEKIREATAEEIQKFDSAKEQDEIRQAEAAAKETARQALLDKLGLTSEEAKLLLS